MVAVASHPAGDGSGERLRQAALELFSRDGYHGVSLRRLANVVGLLPGSLYHHFEGKQDLLFELIEDYELDVLQLFRNAGRGRRSALTPSSLLEDYLVLVQRQRTSVQVAQHEFRHLNPRQQARIGTLRQQQVQAFSQALGGVSHDPGLTLDALAQLLRAMAQAQAEAAVATTEQVAVLAGLVAALVRR
ncbi:TetR/AcrR family transcriptional regulator [Pseudomonas oryzihabitans]|uniref:TetR/AcrR family transcriptional regulator n=1 Tax=Pseudomonas oryzihabitans TaxID=47885 RepID=UPI0028952D0C|nr:TetR/AcrR family transcriptional regulator [Pseudomonas oryzihabitans]MDT3720418.1 TetR/AcrR family transcriptional regulator [Pseudomonas oryzihabitans]